MRLSHDELVNQAMLLRHRLRAEGRDQEAHVVTILLNELVVPKPRGYWFLVLALLSLIISAGVIGGVPWD